MTALRRNLTPFLKAVMKALSYELENEDVDDKVVEEIVDEIIQCVPAENSTLNFCNNLSQASGTLQLEFDQLLNLQ